MKQQCQISSQAEKEIRELEELLGIGELQVIDNVAQTLINLISLLQN